MEISKNLFDGVGVRRNPDEKAAKQRANNSGQSHHPEPRVTTRLCNCYSDQTQIDECDGTHDVPSV
jgi:hypothetical protein